MTKLPEQIKLTLLDIIKKFDGDDSALAKRIDALSYQDLLDIIKPILVANKTGFISFTPEEKL